MPDYGLLIGTYDEQEGTWLIELDADEVPILDYTLIPVETLPDVIPVWTLELPITADSGLAFTDDETGKLAVLMMRRRMAERKGFDAGS